MAAFLKVKSRDVKSKIRLRQSMRIYLKYIPAKFHAIWNDGALGFLEKSPQQEEDQQQQQDE